jgi:hypothetical protein
VLHGKLHYHGAAFEVTFITYHTKQSNKKREHLLVLHHQRPNPLQTNVGIFLAHANHDSHVSWPSDKVGKHTARRIISCKPRLHRASSIVDHESLKRIVHANQVGAQKNTLIAKLQVASLDSNQQSSGRATLVTSRQLKAMAGENVFP